MPFDIPGQVKEEIEALAGLIRDAGGRAFYVGGVVRDRLLGRRPKDIDVEVYGLGMEDLEGILRGYGGGARRVDLVGRKFGVLRLAGLDVDWSIPRSDSRGRHPTVEIDPWMSHREACRRRDLTMNAMLGDVLSGELIDPWEGRRDMEEGVLRTPDPAFFVEDPLRFYRVMQFTARFEMPPDSRLDSVCREMEIGDVSRERVEQEFVKLLLDARRPSLGLRWLHGLGRLGDVLPELVPLEHTPQDSDWHPEGDVWTHTLLVLDAAAGLRTGDRERDLMLMWAALLHDVGKPGTTVERGGRVRTPEHDTAGLPVAKAVLGRLVGSSRVVRGTLKLVAEHMKPMQFYQNRSTEKGFKRLAVKLSPETGLDRLADLALADSMGTGSVDSGGEGNEMVDWFRRMAHEARVDREPEKPVLLGRHLLDYMEPGPLVGEVLEAAYRIQLDEGIKDVGELRRRALAQKSLAHLLEK